SMFFSFSSSASWSIPGDSTLVKPRSKNTFSCGAVPARSCDCALAAPNGKEATTASEKQARRARDIKTVQAEEIPAAILLQSSWGLKSFRREATQLSVATNADAI